MKIVLPGGTDVAEVALFSLDVLEGTRPPKPSTIKAWEEAGHVTRFDTGADGGYLLHIYLDEPIPEELKKYCALNDPIAGRLCLTSGQLGFGGIESIFASFKPNPFIRSDTRVAPGEYALTAFHTDYPDEIVEKRISEAVGKADERLLMMPGILVPVGFLIVVVAAASHLWYLAAGLLLAAAITRRFIAKSLRYIAAEQRQKAVEINYPSIVVEMRSNNAFHSDGSRAARETRR